MKRVNSITYTKATAALKEEIKKELASAATDKPMKDVLNEDTAKHDQGRSDSDNSRSNK